jgi:MazG family protein
MARTEDALGDLVALVERLRRECPWDREQTPETIRAYLLEECYETLEAIDSADPALLREELGDLLFQIFFLATLATERGWFDLAAVAEAVAEKMTARHPHVFGETKAKDAAEGKRREKEAGADPFDSVPKSLPAIAAAHRMTSRAADLGFDWERDGDVAAKIEEELAEWRLAAQSADATAEEHEIGDLLFTVVNLARRRKVDPEAALRRTSARFRRRFAGVARRAAESGREISAISAEELDRYWEEAKADERDQSTS